MHRVLVWSNCDENRISFRSPKIEHVFADRNQHILPRFALATLADAGPVLILDDDLNVPEATLARLKQAYLTYPDVVHGLYGRRPTSKGYYADFYDHDDAEVEMVLGRCMVFDRSLLAQFFTLWLNTPALSRVCIESASNGYSPHPGEDIVMSYAARFNALGKLNRVWNLPRTELDAGTVAMTERKGHWEYRQRVMDICEGLI